MNNSRIQAEVQSFISNEATCKKLMNFYRCSKTISLLNSLYYSMVISKAVHAEQVKEVQDVYNNLKEQLKDLDLKRFCELWEIDYHENDRQNKEDEKAILIKIANSLPKVNDTIDMASTYGEIYEDLANFCHLIEKMKSFSNASPAIKGVIDDLTRTEKEMKIQYKNFSDQLQQRELLKQLLTKFRVELQIIYKLS